MGRFMGKQEQIVYKKLSELHLNDKNPRFNDNAVDSVAESIKEFGFKNPLIIDSNGKIWCGNTRYKASKKLGLKEVPCIIADDLTEEQIRKYAILDNKTNEIADWNYELLSEELTELDFSNYEIDFGIPEQEDNKEVEEDDYEEPEELEPKAKRGEIYQLGNHRLMCGDSTKEEDVAKLMNGELADLVVTDPPYNVNIGQGGGSIMSMRIQHHRKDGATIKNDNMDDSTFYDFLRECFLNMNTALKDGGVFYVWHGQTKSDIFIQTLRDNQLEIRQMLIWNKNRLVMGRQDYQWKHEGCVYGWKDGASHYFIDDRTQTTVYEDKGIDLKKLKKEEMLKLLQDIFSDKVSTTIINEDKPSVSEEHPTMKPVKLFARQIKNSSRIDEIVLDLFCGSGTTIIACEQLKRKAYCMEYDPHYVDVIIDRWEKYTGKKAELINE